MINVCTVLTKNEFLTHITLFLSLCTPTKYVHYLVEASILTSSNLGPHNKHGHVSICHTSNANDKDDKNALWCTGFNGVQTYQAKDEEVKS